MRYADAEEEQEEEERLRGGCKRVERDGKEADRHE